MMYDLMVFFFYLMVFCLIICGAFLLEYIVKRQVQKEKLELNSYFEETMRVVNNRYIE